MPACSVPATGGLPVVRPAPVILPTAGGDFSIRLMTDLHLGAASCDLGLIRRELNDARQRGSRVLLGGDVADCITPADKRRYNPSRAHPRIRGREDTLNAVVEWGEELLGPYADLIDGVGIGNHEAAATYKYATDVVRFLVQALNRRRKIGNVSYLGYGSLIEYRPVVRRRCHDRYVIHYHHGAGKGAPPGPTLQKIAARAQTIDADLYWQGHTHGRGQLCEVRYSCPKVGQDLLCRDIRCVLTGAYLQPLAGQSQEDWEENGRASNYAAEGGYSPHGLGGARVELSVDPGGVICAVGVVL